MQSLGHPADGAQGKGAQQKRHQRAAYQTHGPDDEKEGEQAGMLHPSAQQARAVDDHQGNADDQKRYKDHHKNAGGEDQRQGHAARLLSFHTFFTAL